MLRRTGIDILGDCEWGTHFCVFYRTPQDLAEVLVPYFKAGLEDHELCIWVTSQSFPAEAAKQALQEAVPDLDRYFTAGQIEILDYSQWYVLSDCFDAERVLQAWIDKVADAHRQGYSGLRLTGNTFWLEKDDWRAFTDYEASINRVIGNYPMMALCSYSLDKCGASEVLDVVANHQFALARREGKWEELQSADRRRSKERLQRAYAELEGLIKASTAAPELDNDTTLSYRELILSDTATRLRDEIAERTRMETELRRASLYVRSLIEASLDPLVTISPQGVVTDVNQATEEVTGVPRQHLIGTDFSDYFTEPEKAREGYQSVLSRGFVRDYPLTIRHASGRTIEVLYNATLYRNEAGEVEGVFAAARDITERRQAEDEMRKASLYARSLIEASLDPLVTISPDGKITDVNIATETVTGLPRQQLIGTDFSDYFTEPEKARLGYRRVLAEGFECDYPLTIRHPSGRTIGVLYNATVYRDEAGTVEGVFAAARDITERKRAEQLSDARARQQAAVSELGQSALAGVDADRLMEKASALISSTLGIEYCKVLELLPGGTAMLLRAGIGWKPGLVGSAIVPATANSQAGYVLQAQQPVIVEDLRTETRFTGAPLLHDHGVVSGISVLIAGPSRPFGVLGAHTANRRAFTQDDINFLQAMANVIATALQRREAEEGLRQAHAQLEARVQERTRELAALLEVSRNVAAEVVLDPILATILAQLKTVLDHTGAAILVLEGDSLKWAGYDGPLPGGSVARGRISLGRVSPFQQVARGRQPLVISDVLQDRAWSGDASSFWGVAPASAGAPLRSWLGVPLVVKGELIGVLSLDHSEPNHFTEQHARLAMAFADHAAVAIQNARLYTQANELAALRERQRLARELHDSVSQSLYGISLGAQTARTFLDSAPEKLNEPLDYIISLADQAFADLRALIFELRPNSLATAGLLAGIVQLVEILRKRYDVTVDLELCAEPQASPETKEMLYRVVQEALSNVAKHAQATKAELRLSRADGALLLELQDNGVGFDASGSFPGHLGLRLMRERAEKLGGILEITSSPGAGTRIRVQVPLLTPGATDT